MAKSKLKVALAAEKGVDFKKLKEKRKRQDKLRVQKRKKVGEYGGAVTDRLRASDDDDDNDSFGSEMDSGEEDQEESGGAPVADGSEEEEDDDEDQPVDLAALDDSDSSHSSIELEEKIQRPPKSILKASNSTSSRKVANGDKDEEEDEDEDEEEEEDIPMSDLEDLPEDEREDLIPHQKVTINNTAALLASLNRISIPTDGSVPFASHQSIVGAAPTADGVDDVQDDLKRELAFVAQSLDAARRARALLRAEGVPFSRPTDYFAEMVKDDGHMEKVKEKLVEAASSRKASAEARKQRDLKKFGKQVQVAKLQERQKAKRDTLDKIKSLKRKRQESSNDLGGIHEADLFDVGVDNELGKYNRSSQNNNSSNNKRDQRRENGGDPNGGGRNNKRQKKNEKFGFGGKKRHAKSNDATSTGDMTGFSARRMKNGGGGGGAGSGGSGGGNKPRLGKSRRKAGGGGMKR